MINLVCSQSEQLFLFNPCIQKLFPKELVKPVDITAFTHDSFSVYLFSKLLVSVASLCLCSLSDNDLFYCHFSFFLMTGKQCTTTFVLPLTKVLPYFKTPPFFIISQLFITHLFSLFKCPSPSPMLYY